jgi:hypothetical protein
MFCHDGTAKPAVEAFRQYENLFSNKSNMTELKCPWLIEEDWEQYYQYLRNNMSRLYQRYKEWLVSQ